MLRFGIHFEFRIQDGQLGLVARIGAEQLVGADEVRVAGLAEPGILGKQRVDVGNWQLDEGNAHTIITIQNRRGDERRRFAPRGRIAFEVGECIEPVPLGHRRLLKSAPGIGHREGTILERGPQVDVLVHGIDDFARLGVDQQDVLKSVPIGKSPQRRMITPMHLIIGRLIANLIEQAFLADGLGVLADVPVLQIHGRIGQGLQQRFHIGKRGLEPRIALLLGESREKIVLVIRLQLALHGGEIGCRRGCRCRRGVCGRSWPDLAGEGVCPGSCRRCLRGCRFHRRIARERLPKLLDGLRG